MIMSSKRIQINGNEIIKTMQDINMEINKDKEILKNNQFEMNKAQYPE
jgi:hypothetical protein